jgi:HK97 gp10 family phage protein
MANEFEIKGLKELQKALEDLPLKVARRIDRGALKEAAQIVIKEMAARVPKDTGLASEHFGVKVTTKKMGKSIAARAFIGGETGVEYNPPASFRKKLSEKALHWKIYVNTAIHFLEFGSSKEKPRPFMSISWEATKGSVLDKLTQALKEGIDEASK